MPAKEIKVLLYGLGAIGSFYAFVLSRNESVVLDVVARSNYDAVKSKVRILHTKGDRVMMLISVKGPEDRKSKPR
jgi:ketopantoate reductase